MIHTDELINYPKNQNDQKNKSLVSAINVHKYFVLDNSLINKATGKQPKILRAVNGVTFDIYQGEVLGLVGESGCGKSTLGRCLIRLLPIDEGKIIFDNRDIVNIKRDELRAIRKEMQIIFQNPYSSLNPRMKIGEIIAEVLQVHRVCNQNEIQTRVGDLLSLVGLSRSCIDRFPSMFSGGQQQRISIARALALQPKFIIADEPVSALDVSVQAQVLNLLMDIRKQFGLTMLFIAHDLGVIKYVADRIAVMYLGKIVEIASKEELFKNYQHPYTRTLLRAVPKLSPHSIDLSLGINGELPSPINIPKGCPFHPRCEKFQEKCTKEIPTLIQHDPTHWVSCWFPYGNKETPAFEGKVN
jgi:oligopeptide transport system ATP-binding protein